VTFSNRLLPHGHRPDERSGTGAKINNPGYNPKHYREGRWSNGPAWVSYLAGAAHANPINFAVGIATTGDTIHEFFCPWVPTVLDQIQLLRYGLPGHIHCN
jgi:hypothetical protein